MNSTVDLMGNLRVNQSRLKDNTRNVKNKGNDQNIKNVIDFKNDFKHVLNRLSNSEDNFKKDVKDLKNNIENLNNSIKSDIKNDIKDDIKALKKLQEDLENELEGTKDKDSDDKDYLLKLLMLIIKSLTNGKISKEDLEKLSKDSKGLDELCGDLTKNIINLLQKNIEKLDEKNPKNLNCNLNLNFDVVKSEVKQGMEEFVSKLSSGLKGKSLEEDLAELSNSIVKSLEKLNLTNSESLKNGKFDLKNEIVNLLKNKLTGTNDDKNLNNESTKTLKEDFKLQLNIKNNNLQKNFKSESENEFKGSSNEDKFLKDLASDNKNDATSKLNKVTGFMNTLNKIQDTSNVASEVQQNVTISKENLVNDIIKSVKFMEQSNVKEMTVKVMPRELGEIVIRLTMENGLMKANITANNKEAYNLLNSNIQDLNNSLGNGEIKIQNFTVDIYNGDTTFFSRENSKGSRENSSKDTGKTKISSIDKVEDDIDLKEGTLKEDSNVNAFV